MNDSYLSIVAHADKPGYLLVRSRIEGDIERAMPSAKVYEIECADYRYRADVPNEVVQDAIGSKIAGIDYFNFKASVKEYARHDAYMKVWTVLAKAFGAFGR